MAFGHADTSFYGLELEKFKRKDLRDAGYTDTQARNLLERLKSQAFPQKTVRADSYKSPEQENRNKMVTKFLEEDFVSTVSDRTEDQRMINEERVTLRFLNQSVSATHEMLFETTGLKMSESVFRNVLIQNKHIKTGSRKRKTACCRKMNKKFLSICFICAHYI